MDSLAIDFSFLMEFSISNIVARLAPYSLTVKNLQKRNTTPRNQTRAVASRKLFDQEPQLFFTGTAGIMDGKDVTKGKI
jgi:hypothetical protein